MNSSIALFFKKESIPCDSPSTSSFPALRSSRAVEPDLVRAPVSLERPSLSAGHAAGRVPVQEDETRATLQSECLRLAVRSSGEAGYWIWKEEKEAARCDVGF